VMGDRVEGDRVEADRFEAAPSTSPASRQGASGFPSSGANDRPSAEAADVLPHAANVGARSVLSTTPGLVSPFLTPGSVTISGKDE